MSSTTSRAPKRSSNELAKRAEMLYNQREVAMTPEVMRQLEQIIYLGSIDALWKDHLLNMDHLKEGVGLRGYGQKDPLVEYKKEGFTLFKMMDDQVKTDVITKLYRVQVTREEQVEQLQPKKQEMHLMHGEEVQGVREPSRRDDTRSAATTLVLAAAAKNTRSVTGNNLLMGR